MRKPFWRVNIEHARYGLTGFRIQSAICFVLILSVTILMRISTSVWGVASRCVEADQFWFEPYKNDWPVGAAFFLIFFLLLVWNSSILLNHVVRKKREFFLTIVNFIALIALLLMSIPAFEASEIRYDEREATYGTWRMQNQPRWPWRDDQCILAKNFVGHWRVIERDLGKSGVQFPSLWIDLRQSLTYRAADASWMEPYEGYWKPPSFSTRFVRQYPGTGEIGIPGKRTSWLFQLDGDTLTLTTPEWVDWHQPAKVVLQRSVSAE